MIAGGQVSVYAGAGFLTAQHRGCKDLERPAIGDRRPPRADLPRPDPSGARRQRWSRQVRPYDDQPWKSGLLPVALRLSSATRVVIGRIMKYAVCF